MGIGGTDGTHTRALEDGARRSREAQLPTAASPASLGPPLDLGRATVAESRSAELTAFGQYLWERHKLKIVAILIVLLTELAVLTLGGTLARGPG